MIPAISVRLVSEKVKSTRVPVGVNEMRLGAPDSASVPSGASPVGAGLKRHPSAN
jgi:hypothetical protein